MKRAIQFLAGSFAAGALFATPLHPVLIATGVAIVGTWAVLAVAS
jgi:hypothetical protein